MKNYKILLKIAAVSVIIATLFCFCSCGKKTDVKNAITVEYNGSENHAKPALNINYDELDDLMNAQKAAKYLKKLAKEATKGMDQYEAAFEAMDFYEEDISFKTFFTVDFAKEYSELKNGDEVVVKFNPSSLLERHGQTLKDAEKGTGLSLPKEIKYKVEGLEKAKTFDAFKNMNVSVSGVSPNRKLEISSGDQPIEDLKFIADKTEGLKNGDKVVITLSCYNGEDIYEYCAREGLAPEKDTFTYEVSGLASYVSKLSEIDEKTTEKMRKEAREDFLAYVARDWNNPDSMVKAEAIGEYFLTLKEGNDSSDKNYVFVIFKVTVSDDEGSFNYYYYTRFSNLMIMPDGSISVDLSTANGPEKRFFLSDSEGFERNDLFYLGFEKLDSLFSKCVTQKIDEYSYESSIKE